MKLSFADFFFNSFIYLFLFLSIIFPLFSKSCIDSSSLHTSFSSELWPYFLFIYFFILVIHFKGIPPSPR